MRSESWLLAATLASGWFGDVRPIVHTSHPFCSHMCVVQTNSLRKICLDQNSIGDRGCQLVAASLPSMHTLTELSLGFNKIGQHGLSSLMRSLEGCSTLATLVLSGNAINIPTATCMSFALAHHPRLEDLSLDNCCLTRIAQSHIVVGIGVNRWVPMKKLIGERHTRTPLVQNLRSDANRAASSRVAGRGAATKKQTKIAPLFTHVFGALLCSRVCVAPFAHTCAQASASPLP